MPVGLAQHSGATLERVCFGRFGLETEDEVCELRLELLEALERRVSVTLKLQYSKRKA